MGRPKGPKRPAVTVPDGGWQSAQKTLSVRQPPSEPKRQVVLDTEHSDVQSRRLVWRFSEVDRGGDWPPSEIGGQALGGLLEKMAGVRVVGEGAEGRLRVALTGVEVAFLNRSLLMGGVEVNALVPIVGSLEDVYLANTRQEASLI